jgi:hypothetical protein
MVGYHPFEYLVLALERFKMVRILEQKPLEGLADLRASKISILEDGLMWLWKKTILDLIPAESGRLVSSPSL